MNKNLEAKLSMYQTTHTFVDTNNTGDVTIARPGLEDLNENLQDAIDAIVAQYPNTQIVSIGETVNKRIARETMVAQAVAIANMIYSWNGNETVVTNVRPWIAVSNWNKLQDEEVGAQAEIILQYVTDFGLTTALVPYGWVAPAVGPPIVPGTAADLTEAIAVYGSLIWIPESVIETRKAANAILVNLFAAADQVITQMDAMIYPFQFEVVGGDLYNFWIGYEAARTIIGPAVQHTGIKGLIVDALTAVPLQGVKVVAVPTAIPGQTPPALSVTTYTDEFGNYTAYTPKFKNIPYTVIITKTGYQSQQTTDVFVKLGKKKTINYQLEETA